MEESDMKMRLKSRRQNVSVVLMGLMAMSVRRLLYLTAVDEKNLLVRGHPLGIALMLITAAVLGYILLSAVKEKNSGEFAENYRRSIPAAVGHLVMAGGIYVTVSGGTPMMAGYLGILWKVLGFAAPVCLLLAGVDRLLGKKPFFLLHMIPCLFLMVHIVDHYRFWSSNPQLQDYLFALLGAVALMLFGFYSAAMDADCGNRRMVRGMGLAAVCLCLVETAVSYETVLYAGGVLWALTGMCNADALPDEKV
jgi:chromate transport protein ChrA